MKGIIKISLGENGSLYWHCLPFVRKAVADSYDFVISEENGIVFELLKTLYEMIILGQDEYGIINWNYRYYYKLLVSDGVIDWHSESEDTRINFIKKSDIEKMPESRLVIREENGNYIVTFIKSKFNEKPNTYAVKIGGRTSRYKPFNIHFMHMYNKLNDYDFEKSQISDEGIVQKTI